MYSILVIAYLLLGGAAGGAFFTMAAWSLYFHGSREYRRSSRIRRSFRSMKAACYTMAFLMLTVAMACLYFDLGVPKNVHLFFLRPHLTAITFGAFSLGGLALVGGLLVAANVLRPRAMGGRVKKALEALCVVCSLCVMAYTGVYLYSQAAVPAWHSLWLVALFVCSAASGGLSVVLLADWFIQGKTLLLRTVRPLQKCHLAWLACEAASMVGYVLFLLETPGAADALALLLEPRALGMAAIGAAGMGVVAPAALECYALSQRTGRNIPVSDVICLIGGLCLRWCVVMCATH